MRWLVDFALEHRDGLATDLVLVGDGKPGRRSRVHLYGGTAGLLTVRWLGGDRVALAFRDSAAFDDARLDPAWRRTFRIDDLSAIVPALVSGLKSRAKLAASSHGREGPVQVAVMRGGPGWTALDREVVPQYRSRADREDLQRQFQQPVALARREVAAAHVWATNWKAKGNELDCLAVGDDGDLLAIEVKTGDAADLEQAPLQVALYAQMIERCLAESPVTLAALRGVAAQRASLGLSGTEAQLADRARVRPVVAVSTPLGTRARARWPAVLRALESVPGLRTPEVWLVCGREVTRTGDSSLG